MSIHISFHNKYPCVDLTEYFVFIENNRIQKSIKFETANHHILPQWAFPEFKSLSKNPWNKAILTHKNHLIAHFLLWKCWGHVKNASPLLLMRNDSHKKFNYDDFVEYGEIYQLACEAHAKEVSIKHTGKKLSENQRLARRQPRPESKGMMNVIEKSTANIIRISTNEYHSNKEAYQHFSSGKPSWNLGIPNIACKNMVVAYHRDTGEQVFITTEEYHANKDIYKTANEDISNVATIGKMPIKNKITGNFEHINCSDFDENLHQHTTTGLIWVTDGSKDIRVYPDKIPKGYHEGRSANLKHPKKKSTCPHCGFTGGGGNMKRYHFDNCKSKTVP